MRKVEPNTEALTIANERYNDLADQLRDVLTDGIELGAELEDTIVHIGALADELMRAVCEQYGTKDVPGELGAQIAVVGHTCRNFKTVVGMMNIKNRIMSQIIQSDPDVDPSKIQIDMDSLLDGSGVIVKKADAETSEKLRDLFKEEEEEEE